MKILLFTHEQDIDGIGCYILARRSFKNIDCVPCSTFEITSKVKEYIDNKKIYEYDYIYVTDLCVKEPVLGYINNDRILKNKFIILDHHKTEIDEGNNKYDFVNIIVEENNVKQSATSLFYKYLIQHKYLNNTEVVDEFVESTRQYDVWDWEKEKNNLARYLHIIFETKKIDFYVNKIEEIINYKNKLEFDDECINIIEKFQIKLDSDIEDILKNINIKSIKTDNFNYKVGFVYTPYKYRNDISGYIMKNNIYDIDLVGMIMTNKDTVSYRNVKDVDVSKLAVYFGGKGHKYAATNLQSNQNFINLLN